MKYYKVGIQYEMIKEVVKYITALSIGLATTSFERKPYEMNVLSTWSSGFSKLNA